MRWLIKSRLGKVLLPFVTVVVAMAGLAFQASPVAAYSGPCPIGGYPGGAPCYHQDLHYGASVYVCSKNAPFEYDYNGVNWYSLRNCQDAYLANNDYGIDPAARKLHALDLYVNYRTAKEMWEVYNNVIELYEAYFTVAGKFTFDTEKFYLCLWTTEVMPVATAAQRSVQTFAGMGCGSAIYYLQQIFGEQ